MKLLLFLTLFFCTSAFSLPPQFPFSFWNGSSFISATCGTNGVLSTNGNFKLCTYNTTGGDTFTITGGRGTLFGLIIGGGGAGGQFTSAGGGGGAGQLIDDF